VFDDVVVPQFADTQIGRNELSKSLGYFSSILNPGGWIKAVGTRYHPEDAYGSMIQATVPTWNEDTQDMEGEESLWEVIERVVENSPDRSGLGVYLWPRVKNPQDEKYYGFDLRELSKIKADYASHQGLTHFYAQYYNDPNDVGTERVKRDKLQYYDRKFISIDNGKVYYKDKRLNIFCAMDVAWSEHANADYTAIAVIGIDADGFIYILDLEQFKTTNFQEYYDVAVSLQQQWGFKRMLVESNAGGHFVAQEIENLVRRNGGSLVVDRQATTSQSGRKGERWAAILEPRYESRSIFHFRGGLVPEYEEQLLSAKPRHDDMKDAVCAAISIAKAPAQGKRIHSYSDENQKVVYLNKRFGGRARNM